MEMLADIVDAVIGGDGDTHRDTHTLEISATSSAPNATTTVREDEKGLTQVATAVVSSTAH